MTEKQIEMVPRKELNIYPKNPENLSAIISFYFDKHDLDKEGAVENLMKKSSLSLNQVDFIAIKLSESWDSIFSDFFRNGAAVTNLMRYGIDGLTKEEKNWSFGPYSSGRPKIKEFIDFVKRTETDFDYLEK